MGRLLARWPTCEKLPTDFDRAAKPEDQPYVRGHVRSAASHWPPFHPPHDQLRQHATHLALYGVLVKRYVREPEVGLVLVRKEDEDEEGWVGVPLHGVAGLDISLAAAADRVHALLQGCVPLDNDATATATATAEDKDLGCTAFCVRSTVLPPPPDWPVLSFVGSSSPPPVACAAAEVCLVSEADGAFSLVYNKCLFSDAMMQAMMRCWETLLGHAHQDLSVGQQLVPVVGPSDVRLLVQDWNRTAADFGSKGGRRRGLHQLFEARVDEAPGRVALVGPPSAAPDDYPARVEELTYGELDQQANRLAQYLLRHRLVTAGGVVGIFLERSLAFYPVMLGVLKAGAAYVSIDTDYPDDRVAYMLEDSRAAVVVATQALAARLVVAKEEEHGDPRPPCHPHLLMLDDPMHAAALAHASPFRPPPQVKDVEAPCYVIYTSGSTGKPKGVQISHANALNLVQAEARLYEVQPSDRVLQGFSTSFDASVEEMWMALSSGAALVVGTKDVMRAGPDFPAYLAILGVTCLSTVPTLLGTLGDSSSSPLLPGVRLIITGGEACSKELVARWATGGGRRFFNTYGPTEATVIATYKEYRDGDNHHRVTIGTPLPNYQCYVLDAHLNLLPPGALGELVIGGVSVSRTGYLNLPDKTRSVFVPDHWGESGYPLYRSGDVARYSLAPGTWGDLEYGGRTDAQVKIRGYRVEPSEIEAVLCAVPGIQGAVVDVQQQAPGSTKQLVAFVVPTSAAGASSLDTGRVLQALREKLPAFMIPSHIEVVAAFPTLPSGKLDRRRLPQVLRPASRRAFSRSLTRGGGLGASRSLLRIGSIDDCDEDADFIDAHERAVAEAFESVLGLPTQTLTSPSCIGGNADFFDLGGNSLLVSSLVSQLRRNYPGVTARDVYHHHTVGELGQVLESMAKSNWEDVPIHDTANPTTSIPTTEATPLEPLPPCIPSRTTTLLADLVQLAAMYLVAAYMGLNGFTIYLLYFNYKDLAMAKLLGMLAAVGIGLVPLAFLILVAAKWLVLGRVREGDYPLWQAYHLRFWFVQCLDNVFRLFYLSLLEGTPLAPCYFWALGVRMGRGVYVQGSVEGYDLVIIGDGCSLNCQSNVSAVSVENNYLKLRRVTLGAHVTVGIRAVVQPDVVLDDYSEIEAMSLVPSGTSVPCAQTWGGAPLAFVGFRQAQAQDLPSSSSPPVSRFASIAIPTLQILWGLLEKASDALFLVPFLFLLRATPVPSVTEDDPPGLTARRHEVGPTFLHLIWLSTVLQVGMFVGSTLVVAVLKRLLLLGSDDLRANPTTPTTYPLASWAYFRRWAVDSLMASLSVYTKQLRGTLYLPLWYRVMGATMGQHAEISSFENVCAEGLTLGDQVFVADDVVLGMPHVQDGGVTHAPVTLGNRTFVGNNSVVHGGTRLGQDVLVGVLTLPPPEGAADEILLGCPAFRIQKSATTTTTTGPAAQVLRTTYRPPAWLVGVRYLVEGMGFLLLQLSLATCFALLYVSMTWCYSGDHRTGLVRYLLTLPLFVMGEALVAALLTVLWKWVVVGRYRAGSYPLYGTYVWRTEFVERMEENLLHTYTYPLVSGTVWMQLVSQALGVKMGKRAYLEFPYFCEPDLCEVGDYVNMERTASLQAHLFQDRVRTTGPIRVGDFCSLGADSVVLLGAVLSDNVSVSALSLVLRSEELPSHSQWHGLPAVRLKPGGATDEETGVAEGAGKLEEVLAPGE